MSSTILFLKNIILSNTSIFKKILLTTCNNSPVVNDESSDAKNKIALAALNT
jgi:hypothetical protein